VIGPTEQHLLQMIFTLWSICPRLLKCNFSKILLCSKQASLKNFNWHRFLSNLSAIAESVMCSNCQKLLNHITLMMIILEGHSYTTGTAYDIRLVGWLAGWLGCLWYTFISIRQISLSAPCWNNVCTGI